VTAADFSKSIFSFFFHSSVCPKEAEALAVILGVVGGVLGVGLALLLIWKLLATIQVCVDCEWSGGRVVEADSSRLTNIFNFSCSSSAVHILQGKSHSFHGQAHF